VAKDDMLDWRMTLVSLNSCIACLVVLSLRASLLCSAANRVVQKLLDGNTKTQGMMKIAHKMEDCRFFLHHGKSSSIINQLNTQVKKSLARVKTGGAQKVL
jgi:hypothetical protein